MLSDFQAGNSSKWRLREQRNAPKKREKSENRSHFAELSMAFTAKFTRCAMKHTNFLQYHTLSAVLRWMLRVLRDYRNSSVQQISPARHIIRTPVMSCRGGGYGCHCRMALLSFTRFARPPTRQLLRVPTVSCFGFLISFTIRQT